MKINNVNLYKQLIINWFNENKRDLPWRNTGNPYDIFLSEFIMQQTRIEQGTPYFHRIKNAFPTIQHLASATEEELLVYWQGLGYYSRARNLYHAAQTIVEKFNGTIPNRLETLQQLKGIGEYTAAAIASIGYGVPVPLIDGNVFRVVARIFGIDEPIDTAAGKLAIRQALESFFDFDNAGNFNEALMDFGAMQCTPARPNCPTCPLQPHCNACQTNRVNELPIKLKQPQIKIRHLNYLLLKTNSETPQILLVQRTQNDIWKNLYQFPLIETEQAIADEQLLQHDFWSTLPHLNIEMHLEKVVRKSQKLTHRQLEVAFTTATAIKPLDLPQPYLLLYNTDIQQKPLPILLRRMMREWLETIK